MKTQISCNSFQMSHASCRLNIHLPSTFETVSNPAGPVGGGAGGEGPARPVPARPECPQLLRRPLVLRAQLHSCAGMTDGRTDGQACVMPASALVPPHRVRAAQPCRRVLRDSHLLSVRPATVPSTDRRGTLPASPADGQGLRTRGRAVLPRAPPPIPGGPSAPAPLQLLCPARGRGAGACPSSEPLVSHRMLLRSHLA